MLLTLIEVLNITVGLFNYFCKVIFPIGNLNVTFTHYYFQVFGEFIFCCFLWKKNFDLCSFLINTCLCSYLFRFRFVLSQNFICSSPRFSESSPFIAYFLSPTLNLRRFLSSHQEVKPNKIE